MVMTRRRPLPAKASPRVTKSSNLGESTVGAVRIDDYKYRFIDQPNGWLGAKTQVDIPFLINLRLDPFERQGWPNNGTKEGGQQYFDWFKFQFWRFVFVQQVVGKELQTSSITRRCRKARVSNLEAVKAELAKKMAQAEAGGQRHRPITGMTMPRLPRVAQPASIPDPNQNAKQNKKMKRKLIHNGLSLLIATAALLGVVGSVVAADKKPNIVMLMQDDTGWADFGCYLGGKALGHPTPNLDRMAKEGAMFTCWYGQASCTAGRASFITGRIPIRSALSIVVAPGDENALRKETPTMRSSSRRTATLRTSPASGISATSRSPIQSSTASMR